MSDENTTTEEVTEETVEETPQATTEEPTTAEAEVAEEAVAEDEATEAEETEAEPEAATASRTFDDLKVAMELKGKVKRLELYGAFVDIGIGQDALLHISQLGKANVRNVEDVVNVGDEITVYVLKVDKDNNRIALSMEKPPEVTWDQLQAGDTVTGTVVRIEDFGAFVDIGAERPGMVHVSELADGYVKTPSDVVKVGQEVETRILKVDRRKRQIDLSMKSAEPVYEDLVQEDEDMPTAMELAFRQANNRAEKRRDKASKRRDVERRRREQDDIVSRTLRNHRDDN